MALAVLPDDDLRGSLVSRRLLYTHLADDAFEDPQCAPHSTALLVPLVSLLFRRKQRHHEVRQQQRAQDDRPMPESIKLSR